MKKSIYFLIALALGMTACNNKTDGFKVNVSLANSNDKTVYLQKYVDNAPVIIDSSVMTAESMMTGTLSTYFCRYTVLSLLLAMLTLTLKPSVFSLQAVMPSANAIRKKMFFFIVNQSVYCYTILFSFPI